MSAEISRLVVFMSGSMRFGLDLDLVQEVIAACEISPLPDAPAPVSGVVTLGGEVIAVIDPKHHFERSGSSSQVGIATRFLLVKSSIGTIAIIADAVDGVREVLRSALKAAEQLVGGMSLLKDVAASFGGLIYIFDPRSLLTPVDEASLRLALDRLGL